MINRVVLVGRLTADPALRYTPSGVAVANFTLAVERSFKDQNGNRGVDFIDCVIWRKLAEVVAEKLGKGRLIAVTGRIQTRNYEAQDRSKRKAVEVIVDEVQFLDWPKDGAQGQEQDYGESGNEDDLPF